MPVALRLPWAVFAIPAGLIADRMDRRILILRMDILRAIAYAASAFALWTALPLAPAPASGLANPLLFGTILVAALVVGAAEVFRDNAAQTMLPSIVPHERLEQANGRLWSVEMLGNTLVGPAIGAALIAVALPLPFAMNAGALGLAVWLVAGLAGSFRPQEPAARNWRVEAAEGFRFLMAAPFLRLLAIVTGIWNLLFQMIVVTLVLHAQENLQMTAPVYGLVLAGGAAGGILAGLTGDRLVRLLGPARTTQVTLLISTLAFFAMPLAPGALSLALVLAVFEYAGLAWNIVSVTYRQRMIPDRLLGRVNSLYRLLAWGMMPVGLILAGLIVRLAEGPFPRATALTLPLYAAAIGSAILVLVCWRALGRGFKGVR